MSCNNRQLLSKCPCFLNYFKPLTPTLRRIVRVFLFIYFCFFFQNFTINFLTNYIPVRHFHESKEANRCWFYFHGISKGRQLHSWLNRNKFVNKKNKNISRSLRRVTDSYFPFSCDFAIQPCVRTSTNTHRKEPGYAHCYVNTVTLREWRRCCHYAESNNRNGACFTPVSRLITVVACLPLVPPKRNVLHWQYYSPKDNDTFSIFFLIIWRQNSRRSVRWKRNILHCQFYSSKNNITFWRNFF